MIEKVDMKVLDDMYKLINCVECLKCKIFGKMQVMAIASAALVVQDSSITT
jgi:hypothetical protein